MLKHLLVVCLTLCSIVSSPLRAAQAERIALFGDLHVHTRLSFDAYIFNVRATPDDAYRYAKGAPLVHAYGYPIRLRGAPLDFLAVTDHATYLGVLDAFGDEQNPLSRTPLAQQLISSDPEVFTPAFFKMAQTIGTGEEVEGASHPAVRRNTWRRIVEAAERHNEPGVFTTFAGYEYTSSPPHNLHRNVIFEGSRVPDLPFAATDSVNPEDLWRWMDTLREGGIESLAIPHNSNWSNGMMFERTTFDGRPLSAEYAQLRLRNEPLVEVTQVKGTSDTHPLLSPNDEWANFEIFSEDAEPQLVQMPPRQLSLKGSYYRHALQVGLELAQTEGFNPYQFGLIGSSDTHNAGASYEEQYYNSKTGLNDGTPERRGSVPPEGMDWARFEDLPDDQKPPPYVKDWSASGLAGVWAEENSRKSIYAALRRKETFATTGTRIKTRMFAGFGLERIDLNSQDATGRLYASGSPMGSELKPGNGPLQIAAFAVRDPGSAWLQRLQVIKSTADPQGNVTETVYDIACSDGGKVDPLSHRCPDNGATVDLKTCEFSVDKGAAQLRALWTDPDFKADQRAVYYVRVLENPTCRWTAWDALRAGISPRPDKETTIQERAWTSPVWVSPAGT